MKRLLLMLQFFTRIPLNFEINTDENDFVKGIVWFPAVGFVIGIFNALCYIITKYLTNAAPDNITILLPAVICVLGNCLITGAMQLDGFSDSCDGLYSVRSKEKMLDIMKDSRSGSFGVAGVFFNLAVRISLIIAIGSKFGFWPLLAAIIAGPVIGKTVSGFIIKFSKDARGGQGMGSMFIGKIGTASILICILIGLGFVFLIPYILISPEYSMMFIIAFLLATAISFLYKMSVDKKIGGMTGDTIGAISEIADISFSLFFIIIAGAI